MINSILVNYADGGGAFNMIPIWTLWLAVIVLTIYLVYRDYKGGKKYAVQGRKLREWILFLGCFAFLWGVFCQLLDIMAALDDIQKVGMISANVLAGGIKVSLIPPLEGYILLMFSFVVWFLFRNKNR
jgi:hypothetical protein